LGQAPLELENFPQNPNFLFFSLLLSFNIKKYPGQSWVDPLFTAGQKYAWVKIALANFKLQITFKVNVNICIKNIVKWNMKIS